MKWQLPLLVLLIIGSWWVLSDNRRQAMQPYQHSQGMIFGTVYHATYQCDSSMQYSIEAEMHKVDNSLSMFNEQSTISRINRGESNQTDPLFREVFQLATRVSKATDGAFDITVAPLVNTWGFGFKNGTLPDDSQVDSLRQLVGYSYVTLDNAGIIHMQKPGMVLDCSAVAKGYGVDLVARFFESKGIKNYMIEIGGEVVTNGQNDKGKPWAIGVNKPVEDSTSTNTELQEILHMHHGAMATSGNYRNFYISPDGRKLAHTIDPHTGKPVQHSILSSTVFAPTCAEADAFATSFMVMGLERAREVLKRQPQLQAYFIYADEKGENQVWYSERLESMIEE